MTHLGGRYSFGQMKADIPVSLILGEPSLYNFTPQEYKDFQNQGGIILPLRFLDMFERKSLTSDAVIFRCHAATTMVLALCGVYTFHDIDDDIVIFPNWLQENIGAKFGDNILISIISPQKCQSIVIKPENCKFYELQDAEKALTDSLPKYKGVVQGQWLCMNYQNENFWLKIVKSDPPVASLINTDVKCEIEPAEGLEQYQKEKAVKSALDKLNDSSENEDDDEGIPISIEPETNQSSSQKSIQQPKQETQQDKYSFGNSRGHTL